MNTMLEDTYVVITSTGAVNNLAASKIALVKNGSRIIIVDEGDKSFRRANSKLLSGVAHKFYGPSERKTWFKRRFASASERIASVIPVKCHAENSFGFLAAFEEGADVIIELDDDVAYTGKHDFVAEHMSNLKTGRGVTVSSTSRWYNPMNDLKLNVQGAVFPRGFPYDPQTRDQGYSERQSSVDCVLNMGMWTGNPDLDSVTILSHGGLNGYCAIRSLGLKRRKVVVDTGTYLPICSMNAAFRAEIVPAFYQLYMNYEGLDRFDDIWSGIFLKKISDHLGKHIAVGSPTAEHRKSERSIFRDLRREMEGIAINEFLWKIVDATHVTGSNYRDCYDSIVSEIKSRIVKIADITHRKLLSMQVQKMQLWLETVDYIS